MGRRTLILVALFSSRDISGAIRLATACFSLAVLTSCAEGPTITLSSATIVHFEFGNEEHVQELDTQLALDDSVYQRVALKLAFVADSNLYNFFERHGRNIHSDCYIERENQDRSYEAAELGPVQDGIDISRAFHEREQSVISGESPNGKYPYAIYAFFDLRGFHKDYHGGEPVNDIDLRTARFKALRCSVIGWKMLLPEIFLLRTNAVEVSEGSFRELLKAYEATKPWDAVAVAQSAGLEWTAEQLQAFRLFKESKQDRATVAKTVARAFPIAFNYDNLRVVQTTVPLKSREEVLSLLGPPQLDFTGAQEPSFLGTPPGRSLEYDANDLRILVYDVNCLLDEEPPANRLCQTMDVISVRDTVVRVTLNSDHVDRSRKWLLHRDL